MGAMLEFEQLSKTKLAELSDQSLSFDACLDMLCAMLRADDNTLTKADIVKLVDDYAPSLNYVMEKVTEALTIAFPESKNA
jgi:hypothetical protein